MQIQINYGDISNSEALTQHVEEQVNKAMRHCAERFTRIEVHLHDENSHKSAHNDKRIVMEARPAGADPIAVEHNGSDLYQTVTETANKLKRAAEHFVDRHRAH